MAKKITDDEIELINELYLELGVKARVAEAVGRSASTVSKYIIPGYVSKKDRVVAPPFDESKITGPKKYKDWNEFFSDCMLIEGEWVEMKKIQEEVMI